MSCCIPQTLVVQNRFTRIQREICLGHQARLMLHGRLEQIHLFVSELLDPRPKGRGLHSTLAQLPQLSGYFNRNLLILNNPKKKVVTTNYVLKTSLEDSI